MSLKDGIKRAADEAAHQDMNERLARLESKVDALLSAVGPAAPSTSVGSLDALAGTKGPPFWVFTKSDRGLVVYAADGITPWPSVNVDLAGPYDQRFNTLEHMVASSNAEIMVGLLNIGRSLGLKTTMTSPAAESVGPPEEPDVGPWPIDTGIVSPQPPTVGPWPIDPGATSPDTKREPVFGTTPQGADVGPWPIDPGLIDSQPGMVPGDPPKGQ